MLKKVLYKKKNKNLILWIRNLIAVLERPMWDHTLHILKGLSLGVLSLLVEYDASDTIPRLSPEYSRIPFGSNTIALMQSSCT